jgi:class 3 adenylate cyclase
VLNRLFNDGDVSTLPTVELGVLGPLQVWRDGTPVTIPGAKPRFILTMLGLHFGSVVSADTLVELLWSDDPPRTADKALQTHISSLRHALGDGIVLTEGAGWRLAGAEVDASRYKLAARIGREAAAAGDTSGAVARLEEALTLWRGIPELPDGQRGQSEKTRWIEGHAALLEDRADALLATGRAAEIIGELEAAVAEAPLRERRWGQLMLALYRAGRQGEALGAYQRARSLLTNELGVDPGPDLRRLEAAIVVQDDALELPVSQHLSAVTRAVTFLLTDIEGSTAAWEADADAMAVALARHDEIVEQVVTSRGGRLVKTRGEGDATFSVFDRPSAAAATAIELQEAIRHEPWTLREPMRVRVALHTGEVEFRDGDYFGRAVNRAARLRSLAAGGQILCSGATAELVIDSLSDDVVLADLGMRQLRNLARPEHVFELRLQTADDSRALTVDAPMDRPGLPPVLAGPGPFVGRGHELERLLAAWQTTLAAGTCAVLIAGEPGVGKTRLAGEWARQACDQGAVVLYGRCDEDLVAPYQPFAEALRSLVPCLGTNRLRGLRGVEALLPLVPGLTDVLPDLAAPPRADPDTERYALFDAVVALLGIASTSAPVVLILDDLHWAAKPTLLLLRHLLRFGEHARVQIVGTYRSTDLDRSHPLAAMLADLHRDGSANRLQLSGLDEDDVSAYVAEAGYDDEELARALASVTGGNPFFLIEALRHVGESGGVWDPSTLPQGVREAVSRRLSRLSAETNQALAAAAVVGSRFSLELVERVVGDDLVDAFDDACKAGIVIEEPGGRYRFNHAIVRQSLLAELASVRRMRLHQRIAAALENEPGADDELLAELAYHYFECAWAGNAAKAVDYCRRAADQAMARLAYEGAADLYDKALHALEELDDELPDRDDQQAELLVARCEALLAAGDVVSATGAVAQLREAAGDSARLAAWGTCFEGQLSMLTDPERLDEIESAVGAAAEKLADLEDASGEAEAHTVRAGCLGRLGRIGDCETALDQALTAARRAREHRRVNAVLAWAPLAALWGPNPVPRAGGRCLDVVRLLRITTGSPVVEATSTRCQGVLDAFRGRAAAGRQLIESARRSLTELGMRHALLEVDKFAGIVELVADDPAAAESYLRRAYNGFRRMGLDADTAETAALLARACLELGRDAEADELCTESERLAGHALKASIAWRTVRAQLLARGGAHEDARRVAEEAVAVAERTDALVDHGDACLALARVSAIAGDAAGARAAAERAVGLYEQKGAVALAEKARTFLGERLQPPAPAPLGAPSVEPDNACVRAINQLVAAVDREAWDEVEQLLAAEVVVDSRRKIVGFERIDLPSGEWLREMRRFRQIGMVRYRHSVVAVRGERLVLIRLEVGTPDVSPGAPQDEILRLFGLDKKGRIALQVSFDIEDLDAALAELDAAHARFENELPRVRLENAATQADDRLITLFGDNRLVEIGALFTEDTRLDDRRLGLHRESDDRATAVDNIRAIATLGVAVTKTTLALRGDRLCLSHMRFEELATQPAAFCAEALEITEVTDDGLMVAKVVFDLDDLDAAFEELDARYLAGEGAAHPRTWSVVAEAYAGFNRRELLATTPDWVSIDHRRGAAFASGDMIAYIQAAWDDSPDTKIHIAAVHRLSSLGAVVTHVAHGISQDGFDAEWRDIHLLTVAGDMVARSELFDEAALDAALARFDELSRPAPRLENAASRVYDRVTGYFAVRAWDAMANAMAENMLDHDRRRMVNAGVRRGRDVEIANSQAVVAIGGEKVTSAVIATRGGRLALCRTSILGHGKQSGAFCIEFLSVVEIDADERLAAHLAFDLNDFEAAVAELDARYLAGEAAPYADAWSVFMRAYEAANRQQITEMSPDCVTIDHRRGRAFLPGELSDYMNATWKLTQDLRVYVEAVHQLSDLGAVVTHVATGASQEAFQAEWREVNLSTVDGTLCNRCELFDETDLDAALAKFDELSRPASLLENVATRVYERLNASIMAGEWDGLAETMAQSFFADDRRRLVGAGALHGRDAAVADARAIVELGITNATSTVVATRGERLALMRARFWGSDERPDAFDMEVLHMVETDAGDRIATFITFDLDDIDAAFEELDARFLAGEAAAHRRTWSVIADVIGGFNRQQLPVTTPDMAYIDHRLRAEIDSLDFPAYLRAAWEQVPNTHIHVETVHRLNDRGAVITHTAHGITPQGLAVEWRIVVIDMVEGDLLGRCEIFDEADLDAALARFEQLSGPALRVENAASQRCGHFWTFVVSRDWDAMAELLADDVCTDDRRHVVNAGVRRGRDVAIADVLALSEVLGPDNITTTVIATRGTRVALSRVRFPAIQTEVLNLVETDSDELIAAGVLFDLDDIDAAFKELDARYLAGEAAAHARTWSLVTNAYAALNRHEIPATRSDWVNIDRRRGRSFAPGELIPYIHAMWDVTPDLRYRAVAVHVLSNLGAVVTHVGCGTSQAGFDAEWRELTILTFDGELVSRCETFDEADLDAALARFDELSRPAPQLENAASRAYERYRRYFAARNWTAMAELLTADTIVDDHRRVVNTDIRRGRDGEIANMRAVADIGVERITSTVVATRGERLVLCRTSMSGEDQQPGAFRIEFLSVVEVDDDERIATRVAFDLDDMDAAFKKLDARYLAGEAAAYRDTWSRVAAAYAALDRRELSATTPDWISIDHRRAAAFAPGELIPYLRAGWDLGQDIKNYVVAVHRLSELGAVVTHASYGTSQEGFDAEWREIALVTFDGDLLNRGELFDEADLDAALARFDELSRPTPRLQNAASQVVQHFLAQFATRDWDAMAFVLAEDISTEDRRRVVNAGVQHGRDAHINDMRVVADLGMTNVTTSVVATRGTRLSMTRVHYSGHDRGPEADILTVGEINAHNQIAAAITFDPDDIDAAFEELEARYLAGEAAAHAHTWTVVTCAYAALNRRELPGRTPDFVDIDHRPVTAIDPGDLTEYVHAVWDLTPDLRIYIEAAHQLSNLGAVLTHAAQGTSQEGFDAEWQEIAIVTVEGDLLTRCERFDEADIDAALARFDELQPRAPRPENAARQLAERYCAYFKARDWTAMAQILAQNISVDDRRRVVGAGMRHGRGAEIENLRVWADIGIEDFTFDIIAIRGVHLALCRVRWSAPDQRSQEFHSEALGVIEINADNQIATRIMLDPDDVNAAYAELEARYVAGEAATHSRAWSAVAGVCDAFNRRELPATTPDMVTIDHRPLITIEAKDRAATVGYIEAVWDHTPNLSVHIEAVNRLADFGAVVTLAAHGRSQQGFDAEWRLIDVFTVEGELVNHCEIFDEADLDAALAKFDELSRPAPQLENAATQVTERFLGHFAAHDWDAMAEILADNFSNHDRRPVVGSGVRHGRDAQIADMRAIADLGIANVAWTVIATRGERLALRRLRFPVEDQGPAAFLTELIGIVEIDSVERIVAHVAFDPDDLDAAFEELDARYLVGEAATHAHTWSVIASGYTALNRHEVPTTTPDFVSIDHRRGIAFVPGEMIPYIRATFDVAPDINVHIEAVHRLTNAGAVITHAGHGTSPEGFNAEWREIGLLTVDGDLVSRYEMFDEEDIDAALARFDELIQPTPQLENTASRTWAVAADAFNRRDLDGFLALTNPDGRYDDRRKGLRALHIGPARQKGIHALFEAPKSWRQEVEPIAIRGSRLSLTRDSFRDTKAADRPITLELLTVAEVGDDERLQDTVHFDPDDINAAFEELDARFASGEAARCAGTWSVVANVFAMLNQREIPATTTDYVDIDHRSLAPIESGDLEAYVRAAWEVTPDVRICIDAVHRLSNHGGVVTFTARGTSREGFNAEWRETMVLMVEGDLVSRCEVFDEADVDAALARFDELSAPAVQLKNAATRTWAQIVDACNRRDADGFLALSSSDGRLEDRRKGLRAIHEGLERRKAAQSMCRAPSSWHMEVEPVAIRGYRFGLTRERWRDTDEADRPITVESLTLMEVTDDELAYYTVIFDPDDINGAFAELTARWIASGEVAYPEVIEAGDQLNEAYSRHDWDALAALEAGATYVNHRQLASGDAETIVDHWSSIRALASLIPDLWIEAAEILTHSAAGLVTNIVVKGTTTESVAIELPAITLLLFDGDRLTHMEAFDLDQRDLALARFQELNASS